MVDARYVEYSPLRGCCDGRLSPPVANRPADFCSLTGWGCREIAPKGLRTAEPAVLEQSGPQVPCSASAWGPTPGGHRSPIAGGFSALDTRLCRRTTRRRWRSRQRSARFSAADTVFLADLLEAGRPVDQACIPRISILTSSRPGW